MATFSSHAISSFSSSRRTASLPRRGSTPSIFRHRHYSFRSWSEVSGNRYGRTLACAAETGKRQVEVISLGDTIKFSLSPLRTKDHLSTNVPGVPVDDRNLIIRALNLYRKKTGTNNFFQIELDKKVPTGAGLGGGSSNAATALWAANQFSGSLVTEKELQDWSGEIGSDIPFFFSNGAAYCTGRGEVVKDLPFALPKDLPVVLIKPQEACPTAEVYKRLHLGKTSSVDPLTLLEKISLNGISQDVCINDLGCGQYSAVFMSGSGSTIVGIGSPNPPQLVYDEDEYNDVFISEASFLTRQENQWYAEPTSPTGSSSKEEPSQTGI